MKKVRFAIVGCGRISYRHIEAIQENKEAELVAICDLNLERAKERNAIANCKIYQDYNEMLAKENIEVVCIMTPSGMHVEHAIDIIQKFNKHVVLEKPMALSVVAAKELIKVSKKNGAYLFVVHQNRFNKAIQKIKSAIDSGLLGKITLATIRIRWSRGQSYYNRDSWRGTYAFDGGCLTNQSIHHIDILRWLLGEVESLSATAKTHLIDVEVEDTAVGWVKFKNGALGVIEATTATRPMNEDLEASISILGEYGTVIVEGSAVNKLTTWTFDDGTDFTDYSEDPPNVYGFGHNIIINNVVDTILRNELPLVPGEEAIKSIELLSAIYKSVEMNGQEVYMKDRPTSSRLGIVTPDRQQIADLYRTDIALTH